MVKRDFIKHSAKGKKAVVILTDEAFDNLMQNIMQRSEILSDEQIDERLKEVEAGIPDDINEAMNDYESYVNKDLVPLLLKALQASGNPEEAYEVWKRYTQGGSRVDLRAAIRKWNPPANKVFQMTNGLLRLKQKQDGEIHSVKRTVKSTLRAGFRTAHEHHASQKSKGTTGKLNEKQEAIYEFFLYFYRRYQGPSALSHPLRAAIAPHMKAAVDKKLLTSYKDLKAAAKTKEPLVDAKILHKLHQGVEDVTTTRFLKLKKEYKNDQQRIIPDYQFEVEQMPENTKFGIEMEGFAAIDLPYPKNLEFIARLLGEAGIEANAVLKSSHADYSKWSTTYDNSIIDPLKYHGLHKTPDAIKESGSAFELVSAILNGTEGQRQLMRVIKILEAVKFKSNDTCGLHMHVSLEETSLQAQKNLVKALYHNQDALDGLIHPERRGSQNKFAEAIAETDEDKFMKAVDHAETTEELVEVINPGKNRNSKFDMTGLVSDSAPETIQYRLAGGTNYLASTSDFAIILANFTKQAQKDPSVTIENVIKGLIAERDKSLSLQKLPLPLGNKPETRPAFR